MPFYDLQSNVDHSTLYSISKPFELLHADIADTRFLAKSAVDPKYCLLLVDLFTSKVYIYPMKSRNLLARKLKIFYEDVKNNKIKFSNLMMTSMWKCFIPVYEAEKLLLQSRK